VRATNFSPHAHQVPARFICVSNPQTAREDGVDGEATWMNLKKQCQKHLRNFIKIYHYFSFTGCISTGWKQCVLGFECSGLGGFVYPHFLFLSLSY